MTSTPDIPKSPWPAPPVVPDDQWRLAERKAAGDMPVEFTGKRGALFWLALKTGFFTILTLGFYRFWMKTRMRRWYWSAIRPGGHPMEYVGDPFEKLLGFFIAVVVLTFYIGIVNLLLMFVSFSVFNSSWVGYLASFAGVIPIWFYARYRARRYTLARTRWRGVRFALDKGAWGYAGRALFYWALTILSLGILWPRMTFLLEKYRTDRTYFGSSRLTQGGRWPMLYQAAVPFALAVAATAGMILWLLVLNPIVRLDTAGGLDDLRAELFRFFVRGLSLDTAPDSWRLWLLLPCAAALIHGAIHYRWASKRIMANHKHADGVSFTSGIRAPRITMIYVVGMVLSYLVLVLGVMMLIFMVLAAVGASFVLDGPAEAFSDLPRWLSFGMVGVAYLAVFLLWGVLHNVFVTFPLMRHMAVTTKLPQSFGLDDISQRSRDELQQAEGFAEALDLGAAI